MQKLNLRKLRLAIKIMPIVVFILSSFYLLPSTIGTKLLAGFTPEFMGRRDGNLGLRSVYGLDIRTVVINDAVMYQAAYEQELDVISGYSTDGRLKAYDLVILEDDRHIFPPYYAAPIIRNEALQKFPELAKTLNLLAGQINDSIMTELNYQVDYQKQSPENVAREYLKKMGLYREARNGHNGTVRLGSKIFGEQYILIQMYRLLINGYTDYAVETKTGLGGTKICFDALINNQIDLYPEYTGTGLLVILQPSEKQIEKVSTDQDKVYQFVQEEFNRQFNITWLKPIGFNNAYAVMMRRQQAEKLQVKTISDLTSYLKK